MTPADRSRLVDTLFTETIRVHEAVRAASLDRIVEAAGLVLGAFRHGLPVLACGNGGSAADAQHFAAEFVARFQCERPAWPALALTTDTSALTAIGNDYSYDRVFARQVEAHGRPGGVLLGISTSGQSRNVLAALDAARARGMTTIGLTGRDGGEMGPRVDLHLNVPCDSTARVQEAHRTILHAVCDLVEREMTGGQ